MSVIVNQVFILEALVKIMAHSLPTYLNNYGNKVPPDQTDKPPQPQPCRPATVRRVSLSLALERERERERERETKSQR